MTKQYDESTVKTLDPLMHIRLRSGMYIGRLGDGSSSDDGIYIMLKEIVDNSVDEFIMKHGNKVRVDIDEEKSCVSIRDYGRGIPLGKVIECVSKINTGAKYNDEVFQFSVGLNGVGTKAVNALSSHFIVRSYREGEFVEAQFVRGVLQDEKKGKTKEANGTYVEFIPDNEIFKKYRYQKEFIRKRMWHYAYLNSGLVLDFNGEKIFSENGLLDLLNEEVTDDRLYETLHYRSKMLEFALLHTQSYGETYFSFVNGQYTSDGGTHLSAFREGLLKGVNEFAKKNFQGVDVREGIVAAVLVKVKDPIFESQTKNKLGNTELRGVLGINHKLADLKLRDQLARCCQRRFASSVLMYGDHQFVLLSTCNRTEIYFSSHDLPLTHSFLLDLLREDIEEEFDHKLYSYFGRDCFSHLVRVTAGLDSAILAETEIQGQVKKAYELAAKNSWLPKELHFLFQKALQTAKKIRSHLQLGRGMPNLEDAIFNTGKHFFKELESKKILFIGTSEINIKLIHFLKRKQLLNIAICNRTDQSAQDLALEYDLEVVRWENWRNIQDFDWLIFGTKAADYLLEKKDLNLSFGNHKLIMDLCVPRNVDPKISLDPRVTLLNIDHINRLLEIRNRSINHSLSKAEEIVQDAIRCTLRKFQATEPAKIYSLAG